MYNIYIYLSRIIYDFETIAIYEKMQILSDFPQ